MNAPERIHSPMVDAAQLRRADHLIEPLFLQRWSPRAFDASNLAPENLMRMLEAARWAASAYNVQPWRFVYALRGDAVWSRWLGLLDPFNAAWASKASALVFLCSDRLMPARDGHARQPSRSHRFDAGAAWAQLSLQAAAMGYQAHAMGGIDVDAVREVLAVPEHFEVEVGIAIGRQASPTQLAPALRERELPSERLPLAQLAFEARFPRVVT
ncbi:nitroreductase family protein [Azoarcus sp. L1K30]|uniref:nitroreductase family protein n=1 Tax=Azoarcus sp. L1K30 TaxID=2820277 RepID=UPI001B829FF6|nr:nitroreductase family protein [Azoarcus sp. L1K30]MBR0564787.1 nitroreductase family protein [Azoarcus sp. L1K30]